ncbi:MAG: undecaprenyl/decaprenyl-phosphate alpha-N-acetylglucosaminyl 1-phosphate transferase [Ruminococcaceae bacterium]|nr:undecaprenyl/decaprenyl-phosphate alpha-N-acetylglucosaminyl 1-phosphate transferase [Oscillospiraceae bacterium]
MLDYNIIFSFALAYFVAFATVPIVRVLAFKTDAVDIPKDERRMHSKPIPRWGGVAIYIGFIVSVVCFTPVIDIKLLGILSGSLIIVITGIIDDKYAIRALLKLLGQVLAAALVIASGVRIHALNQLLSFVDNPVIIEWFSIIVTFLWIIAVTNAINLIDGLDGLAASISRISSFALVFISLLTGRADMAVVFMAVAGACSGFLPYNSYPARIFMGDSGALFLGYILSTLSIETFFIGYSVMTYIVPVIVLAIPIFDTSFAIIRRLCTGKGIMSADRGHLHHRLVDMGFSQKETVTIMSTYSALLSITAILLISEGINRALVLIVVMIFLAVCINLYKTNKNIAKRYMEELTKEESGNDEEN